MNKSIRLAFFFDDLKIGGAQKLMLEMIRLIDKKYFDINIYVLDNNHEGNSLYDMVKEYPVEFLGIKSSKNIIKIFTEIISRLKINDIAVTSSSDSNLFLSIIKMHFYKKITSVCFSHGVDGFYIDDILLNSIKNNFGRLYLIKEKYLLNYYLGSLDYFILVCNSIKKFLKEIRGVIEEKMIIQYLGINIEKYKNINIEEKRTEVRELLGICEEDFLFVYTGRITYAKGLEYLLEIFHNFNKNFMGTKLLLLGSGELEDIINANITKHGLNESCFIRKFDDNYIDYICAADLYILPSLSESTNIGVQEAMFLNRIVLSSDTGGMPELIDNNVNGFLFKTGDYSDMLQKMQYIYTNKKKLDYIREAARKKIELKFNLKVNTKKIEKILNNIFIINKNNE